MNKNCIRIFYRIANPVRKVYWFIFRPKTKGVRCVIERNGYFLLARIGYGHRKWTMPGGGVKKHETGEEAVRREVFEEVGVRMDKVEKIGQFTNMNEYKRDTVEVFYSSVSASAFKIDGIEIIEAGWFLPKDFPADRVPRVDMLVALLAQVTEKVVQVTEKTQ